MFDNVLIVCHANVCRSPAAERLFRAWQRRRSRGASAFHSAGLRALDGDGMDPMMVRLLAERGVGGHEHCSRRLTRRLICDADLVLVTERRQVKQVEALAPTSRGKVHALGKWEDSDVPDPHGLDEAMYRDSLALIEHLVKGWLDRLC
ncbi:low molecular weight phosphotyrosine protein phosphatase [Paraburkholderia phosphatilytica]|uniref:arsenate reductase/protein-tyrosine-phosphatase family protein n=1 Tax=Paraburkholderia phosphatilytica TaxID=2282883 RepID=UPI000E4F254D|nr:low molecular weight phosphotyrosine protein phosphatase [Paraburkholderia phosphatilytica]